MAAGLLDSHHMKQHRNVKERKWAWTDAATGGGAGEDQQMYRMEFPKGGTTECPVEGCPGRAGTRTAMRVHFWRRHVQGTILILEESNLPHSRCENCDMFVPAGPKWPLQEHNDVQEWGGTATLATGGGGDKGEHGDGLRGLREAD